MKTFVVEHKTSSEDIGLGSRYWTKLTLDAQVSNYLVGARALGFEPDGVLYDVLRKPGLEPRLATPISDRKYTKPTKSDPVPRLYANQRDRDETPEEYRDRILADIADRPDYYYQRGVVVRLEEEERDAAFDTWQTAEQIRLNRNAGRWPRNVDACSQFGRMCEYWPVCSGEASIDDQIRFVSGETHPELSSTRLPLITSSSARCYRSCPRKYYFSYELGVRAREKAEPLRFGSLVHTGLETWLATGKNIEQALQSMRGDSYNYESAKAEAMLRGYHARWVDEPIEVLAVETEFQTPLVNPQTGACSKTFSRGGKIDAVVRRAA